MVTRRLEFQQKAAWLASIKNNHYASWNGLITKSVAKSFPGQETRKGHGRKIKSGLSSTRQALKEETPTTSEPGEVNGAEECVAIMVYD
jgi:hypothetical protein